MATLLYSKTGVGSSPALSIYYYYEIINRTSTQVKVEISAKATYTYNNSKLAKTNKLSFYLNIKGTNYYVAEDCKVQNTSGNAGTVVFSGSRTLTFNVAQSTTSLSVSRFYTKSSTMTSSGIMDVSVSRTIKFDAYVPPTVSLQSSWFYLSPSSATYNGSNQTTSVYNTQGLIKGTHYSVNIPNTMINAGSYSITIKGISSGGYSGTVTLYFTINKAELYGSLSETSFQYTGETHRPTVDTNGEIDYNNSTISATNVGEYSIYITNPDTSNYSGSNFYLDWKITPATFTCTISPTDFTYNGMEQGPNISTDISYYTDGTERAIDVGSYNLRVYPNDSNYTGSASITWTISTDTNTLSIDTSELKVLKDSVEVRDGTVKYGVLIAVSDNTSIATVEVQNNQIIITGISEGITTITVSSETTTNYTGASQDIIVVVESNGVFGIFYKDKNLPIIYYKDKQIKAVYFKDKIIYKI